MKTIKRISPPLTTLEFNARAYDTRLEVSGDGGTQTYAINSYRDKFLNGRKVGQESLNWNIEVSYSGSSGWLTANKTSDGLLSLVIPFNNDSSSRIATVVLRQDSSGKTITIQVDQLAYEDPNDHWTLHMIPDINISGYFNGEYMGWEANREHTIDIYDVSVLALEVPRTPNLNYGILMWPTDYAGNTVPNWDEFNDFYQEDYFKLSYIENNSKIYIQRAQLGSVIPYETVVEGSFYALIPADRGDETQYMCDLTITGIDFN